MDFPDRVSNFNAKLEKLVCCDVRDFKVFNFLLKNRKCPISAGRQYFSLSLDRDGLATTSLAVLFQKPRPPLGNSDGATDIYLVFTKSHDPNNVSMAK